MPAVNEPNPENRGNRKTSSEEEIRGEGKEKLRPKPEEDKPAKESAFMKMLKKFGYSVWLIVMVIGAALAFIAAIFLV